MILLKPHGPLHSKGFSLLEISLSIVIMSLFLFALTPAVRGFISHAENSKIQDQLKTIGQACRQYYMRFGQWPENVGDLQPYFLNANFDTEPYILDLQENILTISTVFFSFTVIKPLQILR